MKKHYRPGDVQILDLAPCHWSPAIFEAFFKRQVTPFFLPPKTATKKSILDNALFALLKAYMLRKVSF